jgi:TolA-binding protein
MIETGDRLALGVRALRELTDQPADGRASRARVLVRAAWRAQHRRKLRIAGLIVLSVLAVPSASAGFLYAWKTWTAQTTRPSPTPVPRRHTPTTAPLPTLVVPSTVPATEIEGAPASTHVPVAHAEARARTEEQRRSRQRGKDHASEFILYEKAHRLHFHEGQSAGALRLWDAYIEQFPTGRFLPEARFNRAVCLVRLGALERARAALEQIIAERAANYSTEQAHGLLARLGHLQ